MAKDLNIPNNPVINTSTTNVNVEASSVTNSLSSSSIDICIGQKEIIKLTDSQKQEMQLLGITDVEQYLKLTNEEKKTLLNKEYLSMQTQPVAATPVVESTGSVKTVESQPQSDMKAKLFNIINKLEELGISPNSPDWAAKSADAKIQTVMSAIENAAKSAYSVEDWNKMTDAQRLKATNAYVEDIVKEFIPDWNNKSKGQKSSFAMEAVHLFEMAEKNDMSLRDIFELMLEHPDEFTAIKAEYDNQNRLSVSASMLNVAHNSPILNRNKLKGLSDEFLQYLTTGNVDYEGLSAEEKNICYKNFLRTADFGYLKDAKDIMAKQGCEFREGYNSYLAENKLDDNSTNVLSYLGKIKSKRELNPYESRLERYYTRLENINNARTTRVAHGDLSLSGLLSGAKCYDESGMLIINNDTLGHVMNMFTDKECKNTSDIANFLKEFDETSQAEILVLLTSNKINASSLGINVNELLESMGFDVVKASIGNERVNRETSEYFVTHAKAHDDKVTNGGTLKRSKEYIDALGSVTSNLDEEHAPVYTNIMGEIDPELYESSYNYGMQRDDWQDYSNAVKDLISNNENISDDLKSQYLQWASDVAAEKLSNISESSGSNGANNYGFSSETPVPTTTYAQTNVVNYSSASAAEKAAMQKADFLFDLTMSDSEKRKEFDNLDPVERDRILRNLDPNMLVKMPGGNIKSLCEAYPFLIVAFVQAGKGADILSSGVSKIFDETVKLMKKHDPKKLIGYMVEHPAQFNSNTNAWANRMSGKDSSIQHNPISFRA